VRVVSFFHVGDVPDYLHSMIASVKAHMPGLPIVQMTDEDCPKLEGVDEVVRRSYYGLLSKCRMDHLRDYPHDEMLILDTDVLVRGDVSHVFDKDFDVALTKRYRPVRTETGYDMTKLYPYNCGVMFSRNRQFWADCSKFLEDEVPVEYSQWMGEQLSMILIAERGKYRVLDLKVDEYNWTPTFAGETSSAFIHHFKGERKQWMSIAQ
jgi:hypothetical protein